MLKNHVRTKKKLNILSGPPWSGWSVISSDRIIDWQRDENLEVFDLNLNPAAEPAGPSSDVVKFHLFVDLLLCLFEKM